MTAGECLVLDCPNPPMTGELFCRRHARFTNTDALIASSVELKQPTPDELLAADQAGLDRLFRELETERPQVDETRGR